MSSPHGSLPLSFVLWLLLCSRVFAGSRFPHALPGCQTVMPNQPHGYQSVVAMQPPPGPNLPGCQPSNMGSQMHGMLLHYPPTPSYQVQSPYTPVTSPLTKEGLTRVTSGPYDMSETWWGG